MIVAPVLLTQAQSTSSNDANSAADAAIDAKLSALTQSLDQTRAELAESRQEIRQLRDLLETVSQRLGPGATADVSQTPPASSQAAVASGSSTVQTQPSQPAPAAISQDDWNILNAHVEELTQTRVESGSKFPLRLSGLFLMNTIVNSGRVDNFDLPTIALSRASGSPTGSTGFSLRQSIIGIEGTGPTILHASTFADVQTDFFGGASSGYGASGSGLVRLRLARARADWQHTSIIGGLDTPFFSPDSPTSYLTVAEPAFSAAGNLWAWSPAVRIEQRIDTRATQFRAEAGVVDVPGYAASATGARIPTPGEFSRQPAYALRLSANGRDPDRPRSIGLAGISLTQRFPGAASIAGGGGMADWRIPVIARVEFSGEIFAGKGLDGFGAAPAPPVTSTDYTQYITSSAAALARIRMFGGWSQLKLRVNARSEVNFVAGGVTRASAAFRTAAQNDSIVQALAFKNESLMFNYVYRPRSDLLFSAEYRRLRTYSLPDSTAGAGETGLTAGFVF
jgi:hypothetical protein